MAKHTKQAEAESKKAATPPPPPEPRAMPILEAEYARLTQLLGDRVYKCAIMGGMNLGGEMGYFVQQILNINNEAAQRKELDAPPTAPAIPPHRTGFSAREGLTNED